ncbi:hypothetical protein KKD80_03120 [Patescibacteria group bacterium]|nr:hypothetical protein [Patescibacteria group bacterium]
MVVDILGPMMGVAVAAELVPDFWAEPVSIDIFLGTTGATGFWQNGSQTRCTFARSPVRISGECSLAA